MKLYILFEFLTFLILVGCNWNYHGWRQTITQIVWIALFAVFWPLTWAYIVYTLIVETKPLDGRIDR